MRIKFRKLSLKGTQRKNKEKKKIEPESPETNQFSSLASELLSLKQILYRVLSSKSGIFALLPRK